MSFHISFVARSVYQARDKLQRAQAPAAVKALVEKALDAMAALPAPALDLAKAGSGVASSHAGAGVASSQATAPSNSPLLGVLVEVRGSIAHPEGGLANAQSEIQQFLVKPLLD